ncbi:hypothetical protein OsI_23632 [Oryza sativa Indica Group]|uniref:Uncharacterized protein n=1 Tax=Oryza sativa subsp. indica TaxID=39946 RepID=B8B4D5_ORYSI|nr:hypothetical protein OsI_23632 [Oryza sativa Indica Group]
MSSLFILGCPVLCLPGGAGHGGGAGRGRLLPPPVARFAGAGRPLRLTVAQAAANPGPWLAWDDDSTKLRGAGPPGTTPRPRKPDVRKLSHVQNLKELADSDEVPMEPLAATCTLLRYHWYLCQCYHGDPVTRGFPDGLLSFLHSCISFACGPDGYALPYYLNIFGIKADKLPKEAWAKDLVTVAMYASQGTRLVVGKHEKHLLDVFRMRLIADEGKQEEESKIRAEEASHRKWRPDHLVDDDDDGMLGLGGV